MLSTINVAVKGLEIMDGEDAPLMAKYFQERMTGDEDLLVLSVSL